jgi:probable rRNA maturation factor
VRRVLAWEGLEGDRTRIELTLLDAAAMRRLNRRAFGRRALTDVIAFALPQPDGSILGDVYICPAAARSWLQNVPRSTLPVPRNARRRGDTVERATWNVDEELVRLAVHGTLHVLGYDHPEGPERVRCDMWRRQERYVRRLRAGAGRGSAQ